MSLKLLICTPSYSLHGGVERIIECLTDHLPTHGIEVTVGLSKGTRYNNPDAFRQVYPRMKCVDLDGTSGSRLSRVWNIQKIIRQLRPDLVLLSRLYDVYAACVVTKLAGQQLRLAVTINSYSAEMISDLADYAPFVDLCIVDGNLFKQAVLQFTTIPEKNVISIMGPVAEARHLVQHDDLRPLRLGYVGRIEEIPKRIFDLVPTLQQLKQKNVPFSCNIVGNGSVEAELKSRLQDADLLSTVKFLGWHDEHALYEKIYPNLDVILHYSASEGTPMAIREAMSHGVVPVISRFVGCLAGGVFRHGDNVLTFAVGDVNKAVTALEKLHTDRDLLRRLSSQACQVQTELHTITGTVTAWATAFQNAMHSPIRYVAKPPAIRWPPRGKLERWLTPVWAERIRVLFKKKFLHNNAGEEWPYSSHLVSKDQMDIMERFAEDYEKKLAAKLIFEI